MLGDIRNKALTGVMAMFMATASPIAVTQSAHAQDNMVTTNRQDIDNIKDAFKEIYGPTMALKRAQTDEARQEASKAYVSAQKRITDLFGPGYEGTYDYTYQPPKRTVLDAQPARDLTAPVDCDSAMLTVSSKGFDMKPTVLFVSSLHSALNNANPSKDPQNILKFSSLMTYVPIDQNDPHPLVKHIFNVPKANGDGYYASFHQVDLDVPNDMLRTVCLDRLLELNAQLPAAVNELKQEGFFNAPSAD